jgi:hypothetical protein
VLRLGAIAIVLLPVVLGVLLRDLSWWAWLGPGSAMIGGIAFTIVRPRARGLVLLGTMLAVLAGLAAPQLPVEVEEPTRVDLRTEEAPPDLRGPVVVTGFFRDEWTMAEYAVAAGALPQQDAPAEALLVPLLGVEEGAAALREAVIVVRARPGQEKATGVQTVHGQARALEPEILGTLVQASRVAAPAGVVGVMVDVVGDGGAGGQGAGDGWLRGAMVALAMMGAMVCLWLAARRGAGTEVGPEAEPPREELEGRR